MKFFSQITLIIVFFTSIFIYADDEKIDTVYYVLSADQKVSDLQPFRKALTSLGYQFKRFDSEDMTDQTLGFLGSIQEDGTFTFRLHLKQELFINELSPILYSRYEDVILRDTIGQFIEISSYDDLVQYLDFAMNYINGDCEHALEIGNRLDSENTPPLTQSFIQFALGNCELDLKQYDMAIEHFISAIDLQKDDNSIQPLQVIAPQVNLSWAYIQTTEIELARDQMDMLVEQSSEFTDGYKTLVLEHRAQLLALMFDYTAAIQDMDAVIESLTSDYSLSRAYKQRGDIIMLIYEWNRALENYDKAIELDPDYAEVYYRRGILLYTMVEREGALLDFERYLALDRDGEFVESAQEYINNIQIELDALGG